MVKQKNKKKNHLPFSMLGTGKERNYFVENLSMLVASGMGVVPAIDAISLEIRSKAMRRVIAQLRDEIEEGVPLWKALSRTRLFGENVISLVRIGEETGRLSENLKVIALQDQKERVFRSKIRSAMMYPLFVLSLTLFIGVGIAWFILPRLSSVFGQLQVELPAITRILIDTGVFLQEYGKFVVPVFFLVIGLVLYFTFFYPKTKFIGQNMLFHFPGVKTLIREVELARFGFLLGTLLEAGLPVVTSLDSLSRATSFPKYATFYAHLRDKIEEGNSFQKSFALYKKTKKLMPTTVQTMVVSAEQSGTLSSTLLKIGENFEEKTETSTKNLTVVLEPILLVIVWLGVVTVAMAVILPIYSLIGGFNVNG